MCSFGACYETDSANQAGLAFTDSSCLFLLSDSPENSNIYIGLSVLQLYISLVYLFKFVTEFTFKSCYKVGIHVILSYS